MMQYRSTILVGRNLSGRSDWLAARRAARPWPESSLVGPFPDLACTGLTLSVASELELARAGGDQKAENRKAIVDLLDLGPLEDMELYALSGGEAVRVALGSVATQGVDELHIDTAFEQLDCEWRRRLLICFAEPRDGVSAQAFIADNHLTEEESLLFTRRLTFPADTSTDVAESAGLEPAAAATAPRSPFAASIRVKDLSFWYGSAAAPVLSDVSLSLDPARLYFLVGPNGAGKTTFVKLLSGTLLPRRGAIEYGARVFRPGKSTERFVALAMQNPDFQWTSLTVASELEKLGKGSSLRLPEFGVPGAFVSSSPIELPFVFKKRLSIALAVCASKPWAILDEPTIGQDWAFRRGLADMIRLILAQGNGVLVITHDAEFRSLFPEATTLLFSDHNIQIGAPNGKREGG